MKRHNLLWARRCWLSVNRTSYRDHFKYLLLPIGATRGVENVLQVYLTQPLGDTHRTNSKWFKSYSLTKSMIVNFTISWPNIVSQQSLRSSIRVAGSKVGFGFVGSVKKMLTLLNLMLKQSTDKREWEMSLICLESLVNDFWINVNLITLRIVINKLIINLQFLETH